MAAYPPPTILGVEPWTPTVNQEECLTALQEKMLTQRTVINQTKTGGGKSGLACTLAYRTGMDLFPFGPNLGTWLKHAPRCGLRTVKDIDTPMLSPDEVWMYEGMTYRKALCISKLTGQPKHGLAYKRVEMAGKRKVVTYESSEKWIRMCNGRGLLISLDEGHLLKNKATLSFKVISALLRTAYLSGKCRILISTATLLDTDEKILNLLRLLGIVTLPNLYIKPAGYPVRLQGMQELIDFCNLIDPVLTARVVGRFRPLGKGTAPACVVALYKEVIMHCIAVKSKVSLEDYGGHKLEMTNVFRAVSAEKHERITQLLQEYKDAVCYDEATGKIDTTRWNLGRKKAMEPIIESEKADLYVEDALSYLRDPTVPNGKAVLFFNFNVSIDKAIAAFEAAGFPTVKLTGAVKKKDRAAVVDSFNTDLTKRVIVCNLKVGSTVIDLHDIVGNAPRKEWISASASVIDEIQAAGRIYRIGLKSPAKGCVLFVTGIEIEEKIRNALNYKSGVVASVTPDGGADLVLPHLLANEYVGEGDDTDEENEEDEDEDLE